MGVLELLHLELLTRGSSWSVGVLDLPWPLAGVAALMGIELRSIGPGNFARKIQESFAAGDFAPTLSEDPDP